LQTCLFTALLHPPPHMLKLLFTLSDVNCGICRLLILSWSNLVLTLNFRTFIGLYSPCSFWSISGILDQVFWSPVLQILLVFVLCTKLQAYLLLCLSEDEPSPVTVITVVWIMNISQGLLC
jgi:hypothetical protein